MNRVGLVLIALLIGISPALVAQSASSRTEQEKKEIVAVERYFHEALDGRNYDAIAEIFADDGVQYFPGIPPIRGNKAMVATMNTSLGSSVSIKTVIRAMVVEGNQVMAYVEHVMVHGPNGKFRTQPGVEPEFLDMANKTVAWKAMALFIFDDECRVVEEYINRDDVGIYLKGGALKVIQ
jgi:limonene-1,2-epoxide hydrolase